MHYIVLFLAMLNRHTLRIKIMQNLFAFEQCKEADFELAKEWVGDHFLPDLNSMEVQDKEGLKKLRKQAIQFFEKKFTAPETTVDDDKIASAVKEGLAMYEKQVKKDHQHLKTNLVSEVSRISNWYYSVYGLWLSFASLAKEDAKANHTNWLNNQVLKAFQANDELQKAILQVDAGWGNRQDYARRWFREIFKVSKEYQAYQELKQPTAEDDKLLLKQLLRKQVVGKGVIHDYFEEQDLRWVEDKEVIKGLVEKTIKTLDKGKVEIQKLTIDWEDDKDFLEKLFSQATSLKPEYSKLIADNTRNWEVDRLPLTDRVILEMAIAEMISFPQIPVKVTLNEYIELAKKYSTPKSRQFINGILDVITKTLQQQGVIRKSGRGLIDNK
ncbi:MAG: transcription antitermination factor NusB [Cyclobacteriaceae bacterium]